VDLLNPFQIHNRYHTDLQVDILRCVNFIGLNHTVQTFVEQQVRICLDLFPRGKQTGLQIGQTKMLVVRFCFGIAMHVVTALACSGLAILLEHFFDLVEVIGFRTEMAECIVTGFGCFCRCRTKCHTVKAMHTVAFNHGRIDLLATENNFKSAFCSCSTSTG